jgi:tetratricopeptide (TPR) repeat protein
MAAKLSDDDSIERGLTLHLAGRLDEAAALYRAAIDRDSANARAWHLLGEIDRVRGDHWGALDKLKRAVALDPALPEARNSLGVAYMQAGRVDDAIAEFHVAVDLVPEFAEAWSNLGDALRHAHDAEGAVEACRRALAVDPGLAGAHNNLGLALADQGAFDAAVTALAKAIALAADATAMRINLSEIQRTAGRHDDALATALKAVEFEPAEPQAHNAVGNALFDSDNFEGAEMHYRRAVGLRPDFVAAHSNLGNALQRQDRATDAIACYRRALAFDSGHIDALVNLGAALQAAGKPDEALEMLDRAIALEGGNADAHWNRALVKLQLGNLADGFAEYEWRWKLRQFVERPIEAARWKGQDLAGKTIRIHSEQGFGDTIWALRFAKPLAARGASVTLETHGPLVRLAATAPGVERVFETGTYIAAADYHLPIMSLPMCLGTTSQDIAIDIPYLAAPSDTSIPAAMRDMSGFKVGIAWSGRPTQRQNRTRSCALAQFEILSGIEGVKLFSLQVGDAARDLGSAPWRRRVTDLAPSLKDFADTAAAMEALDLVITVDTAVAHLAGALARPVWTLISFAPDWRYGLKREDHPWYPTMRVFRQTAPGNWDDVMVRVHDALVRVLA